MRTIVFACAKGGVGKTTLSMATAVEAARRNKVGIIDVDPQESARRFLELRGDKKPLPVLFEIKPGGTLADAERAASRAGIEWLIVDTPPALMSRIIPTVKMADLVVMPVRPSPLDIEAIDPVVEMCRTAKCRFVFLINGVQGRTGLAGETKRYLQKEGDVMNVMIGQRPIFAAAMASGRTAAELDRGGKSEEEIKALWEEIVGLVDGGVTER